MASAQSKENKRDKGREKEIKYRSRREMMNKEEIGKMGNRT